MSSRNSLATSSELAAVKMRSAVRAARSRPGPEPTAWTMIGVDVDDAPTLSERTEI
jgi:hypothetical protein